MQHDALLAHRPIAQHGIGDGPQLLARRVGQFLFQKLQGHRRELLAFALGRQAAGHSFRVLPQFGQ